jgi:hypothetical protein
MSGKFKRQKTEHDGTLKGMEHPNPIHDTCTFEVGFPDGEVAEYSVNIIAENMYTQCDAEGNQYLLLNEIIDWRKDNSTTVARDDIYVYSQPQQQLTISKDHEGMEALCKIERRPCDTFVIEAPDKGIHVL